MNYHLRLPKLPVSTLLVFVAAGLGCNLLNASDDAAAAKAKQELQSASAALQGVVPPAPTFVVEASGSIAPAKIAAPSGNRALPGASLPVATAGTRAANGAGGAAAAVTVSALAATGGTAIVQAQRSLTAAAPTATVGATPATPGPTTAGLLAVGQRTAANSVSTATVPTTPPVATTPSAPTAPPASTATASAGRRRASVFSGNGLFAAGGAAATRGNRTVTAPTRPGAQ